jgi:UDP-3-O-[3-hydroxymyristoyl] glucosamine N-acyltransferase
MEIDIRVIESLTAVNCELAGNKNAVFTGMQSIQEATAEDISWIKPGHPDNQQLINSTKAGGIICNRATFEVFNGSTSGKLFIITDDPKRIFVTFVQYISRTLDKKNIQSIHPTAILDEKCVLGKNVEIGAYSIIGACRIGDNTIIHEHVKIYDNVTIGKNCKVREFCSIGGEGFGYIKNAAQENEHIPHIGSVLIEDRVTLFPYTNVDRGTLGKTWIKSGTVIDHYVHIGHNTTTGKNNIITAGTVLGGGSKIEDNCFIGVHTSLKEKCEIGSNVTTGMGAVVVKNIPSNQIWIGNPAKELKK